MKFEVGKKYLAAANVGVNAKHYTRKCLATENGFALLAPSQALPFSPIAAKDVDLVAGKWVEHKEPVTHMRCVFWWENGRNKSVWAEISRERGEFTPGKVYNGHTLRKVDTIYYTEN